MVTPMDTCSAPTDDFSGRLIDDGAQLLRGPGLRPKVMREFRLHLGSPFLSLFPAAMFDQVAVVEVAAAVDATGRFAENFADRGCVASSVRSAGSWAIPRSERNRRDGSSRCIARCTATAAATTPTCATVP